MCVENALVFVVPKLGSIGAKLPPDLKFVATFVYGTFIFSLQTSSSDSASGAMNESTATLTPEVTGSLLSNRDSPEGTICIILEALYALSRILNFNIYISNFIQTELLL